MTRTAMAKEKKVKAPRGQTKGRALIVGLVAAGMMAAGLVGASPAQAADTFTVERTIDTPDANIGDGDCDVSLAATGLQCTLRAAIEEANATPEPDLIRFSVLDGGTGVKTIDVGFLGFGALPAVTGPVTIDGYTQPGSSPNTRAVGNDAVLKIELNGAGAGSANGLEIKTSSGSVVKGLAINRFGGNGIAVSGDSVDNRIEGNFIGTDPTGTIDRGNGQDGVAIVSGPSETVVGGTAPAARNLLSGNGQRGVFVVSSNVNRVEGNYIGTDKGGTKDLGNSQGGVLVNSSFDTTLGGATAASRNVVSGNALNGITIAGGSGNRVVGNRVGTTASGTGPLGNDIDGVRVFFASNNLIGDGSAGGSNTIAFNGGDGVELGDSSSTGNAISRNSVFSNGGLGIDLEGGVQNAAGATANDPGDADAGPNGLQNKPVLTSAKTVSGKTSVQGSLNSTPSPGFLVEFYSNPSGDEGKKFIGQKVVSTNASGNGSFTFSPSNAVAAGQTVTATARSITVDETFGNTSEFSAPKKVAAS